MCPHAQKGRVPTTQRHVLLFSGVPRAAARALHQPGLRALQALNFGQKSRLPSIAMLERYGNTGCSSVFYILAHMESTHGVKRGEKVRGGGVTACCVLLSFVLYTRCS